MPNFSYFDNVLNIKALNLSDYSEYITSWDSYYLIQNGDLSDMFVYISAQCEVNNLPNADIELDVDPFYFTEDISSIFDNIEIDVTNEKIILKDPHSFDGYLQEKWSWFLSKYVVGGN
jgi:hypothetical protein